MSKNWCFPIVVLGKALESPLDGKEMKPVNPKGNQSWIFIGRIDAETEASILWPFDGNSWLIGKDLMLRKTAGKKGGGRDWDGWMVQRTWTWVNSGRWWRTGKPGVLQSMKSQRVGHDLVTEQQGQVFLKTQTTSEWTGGSQHPNLPLIHKLWWSFASLSPFPLSFKKFPFIHEDSRLLAVSLCNSKVMISL